jgi:hypothetical protein
MAATKRYALIACGVAGIVAALTSGVLISAVISTPEQVAAAMGQGELRAVLDVVVDRLVSAVRAVVRFL